jgi:hypothetical protein
MLLHPSFVQEKTLHSGFPLKRVFEIPPDVSGHGQSPRPESMQCRL